MPDTRVLVVHAGRYGSTAEVAQVVAEQLRRCGASVWRDGGRIARDRGPLHRSGGRSVVATFDS